MNKTKWRKLTERELHGRNGVCISISRTDKEHLKFLQLKLKTKSIPATIRYLYSKELEKPFNLYITTYNKTLGNNHE